MKIGLLVSLPRESKLYFESLNLSVEENNKRLFYAGKIDNNEIVLLHTHCGPANAASSTESIILNYHPDFIIKTGSCGSHSEALLPGDVVIGTKYRIMYNPYENESSSEHAQVQHLIRFYRLSEDVKHESIEISEDLKSLAKKVLTKVRLDPIFTKDKWATSIEYRNPTIAEGVIGSNETWTTEHGLIYKKRELFQHDVEDKESAYIAQICKLQEVPFIAFLGVSDNELVFKLKDNTEIKRAIEYAGRNAATVALEFINELFKK
ncbi:MAG: 5'-methylthioadenosine/S-adenosylhomocysteine nucleosidase [Patescibacteria group bacterium]|jgi:nucleoside phosphorylase